MKYQKMIDLLDNTTSQPFKFRVKKCVEMNVVSRGLYNTNSQIKLKTSMLKSSLCDIVMYMHLLKDLYQLKIRQAQR